MKQNNESGFGIIELLVIFIILILLALAGWYVLSARNKDKTPDTSTTTTTANDTQTNNNEGGGATKYLEVKEWDVKFALTTDTADAYYDTKTSSPLDSMSLRSHSLDSEPDCATSPQSVASIFRVPKDAPDDTIEGKKYSETQTGKTIGQHFYFIQSSQYLCTDNAAKQPILQGVRNSFNTAGPTIVKM